MQSQPDHIDWWREQIRMAADKQCINRSIGVNDVPVVIHEQRRIRFVRIQQVAQTGHDRRELLIVEVTFGMFRRETTDEQEFVLLADRHIKRVRESQNHRRSRLGLPRLDVAEMPGAHFSDSREGHLAEGAELSPATDFGSDRSGSGCDSHAVSISVKLCRSMTSQVMAICCRVEEAGCPYPIRLGDNYAENGTDMSATVIPAYVVGLITVERINDELFEYMEAVEATMHRFGGRWVSHGRSPEVYEGDIGADIVIIEFPSLSSAQDWYTSDEYKEIIPLRARNCHSIVAVIEGVSSDYSTSETIARLRSATAQQTLP